MNSRRVPRGAAKAFVGLIFNTKASIIEVATVMRLLCTMAIETLSPLKKIGSVKAPSSKSSVSKSSS
ncbi:hypothetical protein Plhal304r1_c012g0046451 [Plasmopara halstedii]